MPMRRAGVFLWASCHKAPQTNFWVFLSENPRFKEKLRVI